MRGMLFTLRWMFVKPFGWVGFMQIGTSCQLISRYAMQFCVCRMLTTESWLSGWLQKMLSSGMQADRVEAAEPKASLNSENEWHGLIEMLRIDASGTGAEDDQCSAGIICKNGSTDLFSDMLIPTEIDQQKMLMAVRMQQSIRLGMVEAKHKSAMTGLVTRIVNNSRRHS